MRVSEWAEDEFLAYFIALASKQAAPSQVREDESDETAPHGPEGPLGEGYQK